MIDWGRIRGWVFDLDDTLVLERDYVKSGFAALDAEVRRDHAVGGFAEAAWRHFELGARGNIFNLALADLGVAPDVSQIGALVAAYRSHAPAIALQPDAEAFLLALKDRFPIALLSDGFLDAQSCKVECLNLRELASPVVLTDAWGAAFWKPHPRGYEYIQAALDLPPEALIYVGDNPSKDFRIPRALGWQSLRIARPGALHAAIADTDEPCLTIATFDDLPAEARP